MSAPNPLPAEPGAPPVAPLDEVKVRRALLSCTDKTGLVALAKDLAGRGVTLVSTGGTARALRDAGLPVQDVSEVTGHPEVLGGRVKTLHPKVHGGLLARRDADLEGLGIEPFELVVVNLYSFEEAAQRRIDTDQLVEQIDVGGPTMLRAAAKTHERVAVLSDPAQYAEFQAELARTGGSTTLAARRQLALAAFSRTASYDRAIATSLTARFAGDEAADAPLPEAFALSGVRKGGPLRYGENPHQRGALYRPAGPTPDGLGAYALHGEGKELSYTNLLDVDAAMTLAHDLPGAAAVVIKHAGPCGAASREDLPGALLAAWDGDPLSAFGSVIGVNRPLDPTSAGTLAEKGFVEVIVAPAFEPAAVELLRGRKGWGQTVRLVEARPASGRKVEVRSLSGAFLVQDRDGETPGRWDVMTQRKPSPEEEATLRFAWTCVRAVRSNAITICRDRTLVGVGGGQPSRVDAVELAVKKAGERARGAALASDAFFPFPDGVEAAAAAGVTAVIQPGGSKKDDEVVARADALGLTMVFTGVRHFRH